MQKILIVAFILCSCTNVYNNNREIYQRNLNQLLETATDKDYGELPKDYKIATEISIIYTKYKDVRNKKLAHSTNVNFTENVGCRKEKGNIFREIKHKDLYHFDELEKDIKQIGNIVQKYANLLDVKMASIDEQLKKNHVDLPKITSEYIKEKSLFSPLL